MSGEPTSSPTKALTTIHTHRMRLVPATVSLVRAELEDRDAFAGLLSATVPNDWPPENHADALPWFLEQLERAPGQVGWFAWYGLLRGQGADVPLVMASGGFKGPPQCGTVEVGYAVVPPLRGRGYATEMVGALVEWALAHPGVRRVIAETSLENIASVRVLDKLRFLARGPGGEPGNTLFERCGAPGRPSRPT